jgi:hypothetical protein
MMRCVGAWLTETNPSGTGRVVISQPYYDRGGWYVTVCPDTDTPGNTSQVALEPSGFFTTIGCGRIQTTWVDTQE